MLTIIRLVFVMLLFVSCSNRKSNEHNTPKALSNGNNLSYDSFIRKGRGDVLDGLYKEALENNSELKQLDAEINKLRKLGNDSLDLYKNYVANNERYWNSVEQKLNSIKDSVFRSKMQQDLVKMHEKFTTINKDNIKNDSLLNIKSELMRDYYIMLQIRVTSKIMEKYQENGLPKTDNYKDILKKYDSVIDATKSFIKKTN
ncbi:hypothetical protein [Flavobacterium sp. J27]|uniref:hypothetical protein n=1 Tax=Flavobacterium sp. J27 TaxID=2060419 RepID=UPI0010309475|nr:hypothetical protein [Flavobacterium sp. J27]